MKSGFNWNIKAVPRSENAATQLIKAGVPLIKNVTTNTWLAVLITKPDRCFRLNGKRVPKSFINLLVLTKEQTS